MDNNSVKDNISAIRRRNGLSQEAMAEKMGISRTAYRNIETGSTKLISDSIIKIAEILGTVPEELLLGYIPEKGGSESREMTMRYGAEIQKMETAHADEINSLKSHMAIQGELIATLQETVKTKDEVIGMLRKMTAENPADHTV